MDKRHFEWTATYIFLKILVWSNPSWKALVYVKIFKLFFSNVNPGNNNEVSSIKRKLSSTTSECGVKHIKTESSVVEVSGSVAGPSGIRNSEANSTSELVFPDNSENGVVTSEDLASASGNPLSAPDLQLDYFSDTSSEYEVHCLTIVKVFQVNSFLFICNQGCST